MSDSFEMLVDADANAVEAEYISRAVLDRFRELGLITGEPRGDCVLGETGYRPGPVVAKSYKLGKRECRFWELNTCGVEPRVSRGFNEWSLGPVCEGFTCSSCGADIEPFGEMFGDTFGDSIASAIGEWMQQSGPGLVPCPRCEQMRSIAEWQCKPPLGFGNLAFRFWNWPPFDSSSWMIDIPAIVRQVTGHAIVRTYGHI